MPLLTIPHKAADYDTYHLLSMHSDCQMFGGLDQAYQNLLLENMLELLIAF